jgi:hypothetical protein
MGQSLNTTRIASSIFREKFETTQDSGWPLKAFKITNYIQENGCKLFWSFDCSKKPISRSSSIKCYLTTLEEIQNKTTL